MSGRVVLCQYRCSLLIYFAPAVTTPFEPPPPAPLVPRRRDPWPTLFIKDKFYRSLPLTITHCTPLQLRDINDIILCWALAHSNKWFRFLWTRFFKNHNKCTCIRFLGLRLLLFRQVDKKKKKKTIKLPYFIFIYHIDNNHT